MLNKSIFLETLQQLQPEILHKKLLVAVSGGVDSMVLSDLLLHRSIPIAVVHVNFGLRGNASDKDCQLVKDFCKKNKIPFHVYQVNDDEKPKHSIQVWARDLRYRFFRKLMADFGYDYLLTAHHLDDQLETFLINLSRGSGIDGLCGIPQNNNQILRPLLQFSKEEILDYAQQHAIIYREDSSNASNDYLRNAFRNKIIPEIKNIESHFLNNFQKSLSHLKESKALLDQHIQDILHKIAKKENENLIISRKELVAQDESMSYQLLKKFGFDNKLQVKKILNASSGKVFTNRAYRLEIYRDKLMLYHLQNRSKPNPENLPEIILNFQDSDTNNPQVFTVKNLTTDYPILHKMCWKLDAEKLVLPLILRPPKNGELFFPIGMIGKKKISKFLKDEKIPTFMRPKIRVICDSGNQIIGVFPYRQDRRFLADKSTTNTIIIQYTPENED